MLKVIIYLGTTVLLLLGPLVPNYFWSPKSSINTWHLTGSVPHVFVLIEGPRNHEFIAAWEHIYISTSYINVNV